MINSVSEFSKFVAGLSGSRVFLEPLAGNNGDALILKGMHYVLEQNAIQLTSDPADADVILFNGGGAMNDLWPVGAGQVLENHLRKYPDKKYVIAPSSYLFNTFDFSKVIGLCKSSITLFCREKISEKYLIEMQLPEFAEIRLSQDLALELKDSPFIRELKSRASSSHVLCALRKDLEGNASAFVTAGSAPWLPRAIRRPLSKIRDRLAASFSKGTIDRILTSEGIKDSKAQIIYRDVSVSVSFEEFCDKINNSKLVITDRLHVALLGFMLGKRIALLKGNYHKIEGVYNQSLVDSENVTLYQAS